MYGRREENMSKPRQVPSVCALLCCLWVGTHTGCGTLRISLGSLAGGAAGLGGANGQSSVCRSDQEPCSDSAECCSQICSSGICRPLNLTCRTSGNDCETDDDCCSHFCHTGQCSTAGSFCIQPGDACETHEACCTGVCVASEDSPLGTCGEASPGPASCTGVAGLPCDDCGDCCSRLCAPFGPFVVNVCQLPAGCRMTGEVCHVDEDCCGGDESSDIAGAGRGSCERAEGAVAGICRNVQGCSPQGNACHLQDYSCSVSAAPNKCCDGSTPGTCALDESGAPRCTAQELCKQPGDACASRIDCCDLRPCLPDAAGHLVCSANSDSCVNTGATCTATSDCCPGTLCRKSAGALGMGECQPTEPASDACSFLGQRCNAEEVCCAGTSCVAGVCQFGGP